MKVKTLLIFVLLGMVAVEFLSYPVNAADSGTLTIENAIVSAYSTTGTSSGAGSIDFTNFRIYATDYNILYSFDLNLSGIKNFPKESDSTSFTCTSGCSGSGTLSYTKSTGKVYWLTGANAITVSNSNITFSYANSSFFSGFTDVNPLSQNDLETVSSAQPIKIESTGGSIMSKNPTTGRVFDYGSFTATTVSNTYAVTYSTNILGQIIFNTSVSKSGATIPTRITLKNQTNVNYSTETTLNTVSFTIINTLTTGIYIRAETSSGSFTEATVNTTGVSVVPPIVPGGGGSSSGQISFDFTNTTPGAVYGINASISNANFSSFNTYYIDVFDPTGTEIVGFPASFGVQNYSTGRFYYFNKFGTYTANLSYCSFINPLCPSVVSPTRLDTASLTINQIALSYNISTDKPNYQQGDTIYINATNPGLTKTYVTATGTTGIITELAWNAQVDANSIRIIVGTIPNTLPLGTYFVSLAGSQGYNPILAQSRFNITANTPDNVLGLGWNDYLYTIGGTGILTYKSNINQSQITIYKQGNSNEGLVAVKTFFAPAGNMTGNYSQIFNSPGNWYAYIVDTVDTTNFKWANTSVLNPNPSDPNAQNLCKSKESYVCWDKHEYTQGDAYIINYKIVVPSVINYFPTINVYDPDDKVVRTIKLNYSIWNNTITGAISGKFGSSSKTGIWFVRAEKINQITSENNGEIANSATSVIGRNATATTTSPIPSSDQAQTAFWWNLITFLSMPAFWGLFLFTLVIYIVATNEKAAPALGIVAFIVANIEAVIGLWAPFTMYILIITWIIAAIYFTLGRKTVTGTG